jgi:hypothetical protein
MINSNEGKWTAGADPELMLTKNGEYVAVQPYVLGTKEEPQPLPYGGNAQRDNVAIEFGIVPAKSSAEFVMNIGNTISDLIDILPEDVNLNVIASALFPGSELTHPECNLFGCNEDYNAWTMLPNDAPSTKGHRRLRCCGGHFHTGYVVGSGFDFLKDKDGKGSFIRALDATIGQISTILDDNKEAIDRRKLYGKAGCYRETDYGVEYRTMSNFWIKSPRLVELVYSVVGDTLEIVRDHEAIDLIGMLGPKNICDAINNGDADASHHMYNEHIINFLSLDSIALFNECLPVIDTYDFTKEWENI